MISPVIAPPIRERERERERKREGGRERGREGERESVCVCARAIHGQGTLIVHTMPVQLILRHTRPASCRWPTARLRVRATARARANLANQDT